MNRNAKSSITSSTALRLVHNYSERFIKEPQAESDSRIRRRIFVHRKSAEKYGYSIFVSFLLGENHIHANFRFIL